MSKERYSIRTNKDNGLINVFFGTMYCNAFNTKEEAKHHIKDMKKKYKGVSQTHPNNKICIGEFYDNAECQTCKYRSECSKLLKKIKNDTKRKGRGII
jgi:hypothetical protein